MCPVGAAQDIFSSFRKNTPQSHKTATYTRFALLTATLLGIATGSSILHILEPNTQLIRSSLWAWQQIYTKTPSIPLITVLILFGVVSLSLWRRRFFCRYICPSGALLSIISLRAAFRIRINPQTCKSCQTCRHICPTGAITDKGVSQEPCIVCFECVSACPHNAISYRRLKGVRYVRDITQKERRKFIAMLVSGLVAALTLNLLRPKHKQPRPPSAKRTLPQSCIHCMACVVVCPNGVIVPSPDLTPILDFTNGNCEYRCLACGNVCPTSAIKFANIKQKWQTPIGVAKIDEELCLAHSGKGPCMGCQEVCPAEPENAIKSLETPWGWKAPKVEERVCVGCGTCVFNCPVKAIEVVP